MIQLNLYSILYEIRLNLSIYKVIHLNIFMAYGIIRIEVICVSVGKRIMQARKKAGLTQAQLAETLGLATITIRQYESGKRKPSIEQIKRIANVLETRWYELMSDDLDEQISLISNDIFDIDESFLDYAKNRKLNWIYHGEMLGAEYKYDASQNELTITPTVPPDEIVSYLLELEKEIQKNELISIFSSLNQKGRKQAIISLRNLKGIEEYVSMDSPPDPEEMLRLMCKFTPKLALILGMDEKGQFKNADDNYKRKSEED